MDRKKLLSTIQNLLLQLNNKLPENLGYYWVTNEELHSRLIHSGVSKLLTLDHVKEAIARSNRAQKFLAVWRFNNTNWYRSKIVDAQDGIKVVPLDQRYKTKVTPVKINRNKSTNMKTTTAGKVRIDIYGDQYYFRLNDIVECKLINEALEQLEDLGRDVAEERVVNTQSKSTILCPQLLFIRFLLLTQYYLQISLFQLVKWQYKFHQSCSLMHVKLSL